MGVFLKRGSYYIDYYVCGKRKREKVGPSKRLAELVLKKRKVQLAENKFLDIAKRSEMRFDELCEMFLKNYSKPNKKKQSHRRDVVSVKSLKGFFGKRLIDDITAKDVEQYKVKRSEIVNPATVNREIACLKNMYNRAIDWEITEKNPMKRVKLFRESPGRDRFLSEDELKRLFASCSGYLRDMIVTALNTGMRLEEILSLKKENVNFEQETITIPAYIAKNNERNEVPVNSVLKAVLEESIRKHPESEYVFCDENGNRFKKIRRSFLTTLKKAGIANFRFHDLRHCFCSYLAMAGVNIFTIKELARHKSIEMTMRYAHLAPKHKKQAIELLGSQMDTYMDTSTTRNDTQKSTITSLSSEKNN